MSGELSVSLIITLIGMGVVFIVLIVLANVLNAMKLLSGDKKRASNGNKPIAVSNITPSEVAAEPSAASKAADDNEITAVIAAAIAAYMGGQKNVVVKSIRRVEDYSPTWAKVGRSDQMLGRL